VRLPGRQAHFPPPPIFIAVNHTNPFDPASIHASDQQLDRHRCQLARIHVQYLSSVGPGVQTPAIAANALHLNDGDLIVAWQTTFYYEAAPLAIASSAAQSATVSAAPAQLRLNFNKLDQYHHGAEFGPDSRLRFRAGWHGSRAGLG
jgi:hypothetical protein